VLSGGVFQNRRLLEAAGAGLDAAGVRVLTPQLLPVNDGGIAYGQVAVAAEVTAGIGVDVIAARFHNTIARGTVQACRRLASAAGSDLVVLSGGVFQNRRLLETAAASLDAAGLRVLTPERLPGNDGGIAYGQAVVAARRATSSRS